MTLQGALYPILWLVVFPGFLFTGVVGLLITWIDRKVTARVQMRVGPPWYQPFADVLKLLLKETIVPAGSSRLAFLGAPLVALAGAVLVSTMVWVALIWPEKSFVGDLFVLIYMMVLPSLGLILGGAASRNPLAAAGASREMKLVLGYELPFILALAVVIAKSGGAIRLGEIVARQNAGGAIAASVSGALALIAVILVIQAKAGLVPFDQAEAETELMGGALIEYSGAPLAAFRLSKAMLYFALPVFAVAVLTGGIHSSVAPAGMVLDPLKVLYLVLKIVGVIVIMVLIRNTNPRVRIEHAVRFFWGPVTAIAGVAVVLAIIGRAYGVAWL